MTISCTSSINSRPNTILTMVAILINYLVNSSFENLNLETGNLLMWVFLINAAKDLLEECDALDESIRLLSKEECRYYELKRNCKKQVDKKLK